MSNPPSIGDGLYPVDGRVLEKKGSDMRDRLLSTFEAIWPPRAASAFAICKNKSSLFRSSLLEPLLSSSIDVGINLCGSEFSFSGASTASEVIDGS